MKPITTGFVSIFYFQKCQRWEYIISCEEKQEKSDAASAASLLWFVWRLAFAEKFTHSTANDERPTANGFYLKYSTPDLKIG